MIGGHQTARWVPYSSFNTLPSDLAIVLCCISVFLFSLFLPTLPSFLGLPTPPASPVPKVRMLSPCCDDRHANSILAHLDFLCFVSCFQNRFQICGIRDTVSSFLIYKFYPFLPFNVIRSFPLLQGGIPRVYSRGRIIHPQTILLIFPCLRSRVIGYYGTPSVRYDAFGIRCLGPTGHPRV